MTQRIYLDENLVSAGYSGITRYDTSDIHISVGSTNEGWREVHIRQIRIDFKEFDIEIIGGAEEVYNFERNRQDMNDEFAYNLLFKHLTHARFQDIISNVVRKARWQGRNEIRHQFHKLLNEESEY